MVWLSRPKLGHNPTVLVVDDDPFLVSALTHFLSQAGMAVLPAYNGPECLQFVHQKPVDVILLDVVMPEMDGLEVCALLKSRPLYRSIPIILLTARDDPVVYHTGLWLGADELMIKPICGRDLLARIWAQIERKALGGPS